MDDINPDMPNVDVAIVIGANDVVNPAAYNDPGSPIYGMPIIDAHLAKNIIIMKRGMGKGYAGIENELFFNEKPGCFLEMPKARSKSLLLKLKQCRKTNSINSKSSAFAELFFYLETLKYFYTDSI
jgi:H+-translocating NAD(P) transhydrogenase subunit beta